VYVSLKDVAARAGVSFQTASKVLNGHEGVASAATAQRILVAAQQLGYVPNELARGLVRRGSITAGILADDLADPALSRFVAGAHAALATKGHAAVLFAIRPEIEASQSLRKVLEHRVDGLLVVAPSLESDTSFRGALREDLPLVSLNHLPGTHAVLLGSDHRTTGTMAAAHLIELGHREIATVTGPAERQVVRLRHDAFRRKLAEAGIDLSAARVERADWSPDGAYAAAQTVIERDAKVTAFFVHNDTMAVGVLRLLADRDIGVPGRVSVIGCDDLPMSRFLVPSLTTMHVPFTETGERAAEVLLDLINGLDAPRRERLPVYFVARDSTAPPPRAARRPRARATTTRAVITRTDRRARSSSDPLHDAKELPHGRSTKRS
jgi:LacI family transcriptional regulator